MREILFRGKAKAIAGSPYNNGKSDGEWVFGYIFPDLGALKIRQFEPDKPECNDYEIDPETIGQFTGLTDKNGTKIFEGDILTIENEGIYAAIKYNESNAAFYVEDEDHEDYLGEAWETDVVIIGNIFDNPELIKEVKKNDG
ncbi:MAG: YopX family protein [Ruminiclostridium sp.]